MRYDRCNSILVLDSGIGGMTVVKAIRKLSGSISVSYISDNAYFPYGEMDADFLTKRVFMLVEQALGLYEFDAVVIACNTASTLVLNILRKAFSVPFIGVVPPIKTAGESSKTRVVGLLATEGTVHRRYIDDLIADFLTDCQVFRIGCPDLALLAEEKARGRVIDSERLRSALVLPQDPDFIRMDVIVMGCTHYPILQLELERELAFVVSWLDPALPVARHLIKVLEKDAISTKMGTRPIEEDAVFFTGRQALPIDMKPFLKKMGFTHLAYWP